MTSFMDRRYTIIDMDALEKRCIEIQVETRRLVKEEEAKQLASKRDEKTPTSRTVDHFQQRRSVTDD